MLGFCASLLTASMAAKVTFLTPAGRPEGLSPRPSIPYSFHLSLVR